MVRSKVRTIYFKFKFVLMLSNYSAKGSKVP